MLKAEVVGWRRRHEGNEFIVYEVAVQYDDCMWWSITRRYRDFRALHRYVQNVDGLVLPPGTTGASMAYEMANLLGRRYAPSGRRVAGARSAPLSEYVQELCRAYRDRELSPLAEAAVLEFFGAARQSPLVRTIHVRQLPTFANPGDLVLFRSRERVSTFQRCLTRATWDHVALVVSAPGATSLKLLLEATCDGIALVPIIARIRGYDAHKVAIRRLRPPPDEDPAEAKDRVERLARFSDSVEGADYGFGFKSLIGGIAIGFRRSQRSSTSSSTTRKKFRDDAPQPPPPLTSVSSPRRFVLCSECGGHQDKVPAAYPAQEKFFCSQLTAHALQIAGVVRDDVLPEAFWPGTFSTETPAFQDSLLVDGFSYADEILIDTHVPDVAQSAHRRMVSPTSSPRRPRSPTTVNPLTLTPRATNHLKRHARRHSSFESPTSPGSDSSSSERYRTPLDTPDTGRDSKSLI